jgi:pimeloyl-ACP methyl ester carboxylesterase
MIIFLHGGGVPGWMWRRQAEFFAKMHVLVPDLEGHGSSIEEPFVSIADSAGSVIHLIDSKAGGRPVTLVGLSLGAQIAVEILSQRPEIADCAIINSALTRPMPMTRKLLRPMMKMSFDLIQNRSFAKLEAAQFYISDSDFETYFEDSKKMTMESLLKILDANMSYTIPPAFRNTSARILLLAGAKEKSVMKRSAIDLQHANHSACAYIVPGIGHGVSLADPDLFNEITLAWIEDRALPESLKKIESK